MSTQTLQPLIWLARRGTSSRLTGVGVRPIALASALRPSIAPATTKAGLGMRAVVNMGSGLLSHRVVDVGQALDQPEREDVTRWTRRRHSRRTDRTCTPWRRGSSARA